MGKLYLFYYERAARLCDLLSVLFTIDARTGEIRTADLLTNYSRAESYLVNVSAEADDPPRRVAFTLVAIRVVGQADHDLRPFFIRPDRDGKQFSFDRVRQKFFVDRVAVWPRVVLRGSNPTRQLTDPAQPKPL